MVEVIDKRFAVIENGVVVNFVMWNGISSFIIDGELVELFDDINPDIGWEYIAGKFIEPESVTNK